MDTYTMEDIEMDDTRLYVRLVNTALSLSGFDPRKVDGYLIARKLIEESGSAESFIDSLTHERICHEVGAQFKDEGISVIGCACLSCGLARELVRERLAKSTRR